MTRDQQHNPEPTVDAPRIAVESAGARRTRLISNALWIVRVMILLFAASFLLRDVLPAAIMAPSPALVYVFMTAYLALVFLDAHNRPDFKPSMPRWLLVGLETVVVMVGVISVLAMAR
jgi:hypothetical protein